MYNPEHVNQVKKEYPIGGVINDAWRWEGKNLTVVGYVIREDLADNTASVAIKTQTESSHGVVLELSQLPQ